MARLINEALFTPAPAGLVVRVEDAKRDQAARAYLGAYLEYDDFVHEATLDKLRRVLGTAIGVRELYRGIPIVDDWERLCRAAIPEIVDRPLQYLFNMDHADAGHDEYGRGKLCILKNDFVGLHQRALALVKAVEPDRWSGRNRTIRANGIRLVTSGRMNKNDWTGLAQTFWARWKSENAN
jgi:hypothetical protein